MKNYNVLENDVLGKGTDVVGKENDVLETESDVLEKVNDVYCIVLFLPHQQL
jgi:hypothetical protein